MINRIKILLRFLLIINITANSVINVSISYCPDVFAASNGPEVTSSEELTLGDFNLNETIRTANIFSAVYDYAGIIKFADTLIKKVNYNQLVVTRNLKIVLRNTTYFTHLFSTDV